MVWKLSLEFFWRKNPNGSFYIGICFENQLQDQKDFLRIYYEPVIRFFWNFSLLATDKLKIYAA